MDGPLLFLVKLTWTDRCQNFMYFCNNLFYKRRLNWEQNKNITFPEGRWTTKRLKLFKMKFLHGFPLNKTQRSATYLPWNSTWTYSWATCESSPWWPCSIAELAVVVLIASLCEQSSILFKLGACSRMFKRLCLMTTETCRGEGRITVCPLPFSPC